MWEKKDKTLKKKKNKLTIFYLENRNKPYFIWHNRNKPKFLMVE
jgi:hypothetical protein